MKKLIFITLLFACLIGQAQDTVFHFATYKPISKDYFIDKAGVLHTSYGITIKDKQSADGITGIMFKGTRNKILSIMGKERFLLKDIEIYSDSGGVAICGVYISDSSHVTVDHCYIHNTQWGIRAFQGFNSLISVKNTEIAYTEDDGVYGQNTWDWEFDNCYIHDVNMNYFLPNSNSGGDCIQIAYRQGHIRIHNSALDHSSTGWKFCVIVGHAEIPGKSFDLYDNWLIGRSYQDRLKEDPSTHNVQGNSLIYEKPVEITNIYNNVLINGSNTYFQYTDYPGIVNFHDNFISNPLESIVSNSTWKNNFYNNTFEKGIQSYFKNSLIGDNALFNVFYTNPAYPNLAITNVYNNKPAAWSASIDPKKIPFGWGCSSKIKAMANNTIKSTVTDTVHIPKYYSVPKDSIIFKYETINYYKRVEVMPVSIDSIMNKEIQQYFDKIKSKLN